MLKGQPDRPTLAHRWKRLLRKLGGKKKTPFLVFDPTYRQHLLGAPVDPLRGEKILAFLSLEHLIQPAQISRSLPAAMKNLLLAHSPEYLQSLQKPAVLTQILGTPVEPGQCEPVLQLQRLMVGGTIQATRLALMGAPFVLHLGGGFHHASRDRGGGFCVFNDVAVAVLRLRQRGFSGPILVVDLDLHDGNGTREIFAQDTSVFTLSIHNHHWSSPEAVASLALALGDNVDDDQYLAAVEESLNQTLARFSPDLVFFLAGSDVAGDDALGNWRISPEAILARDQMVLSRCQALSVPVVMLLAGGYGERCWRYTARTLSWYLAGEVLDPPSDEVIALARLRQMPQLFHQEEEEESWGLSEEDLVSIFPGLASEQRFLGSFSPMKVEVMLEQMGLLQQIRAKGFSCPTVSFDMNNPLGHTLRIHGDPQKKELVMELRLARSSRAIPGLELLSVEWLLLQNPKGQFTPSRPKLPGQQYPGLGLLAEVFAWLVLLCEDQAADGLYFRPSHYHLAALARRHAFFLHPHHEALFQAISRLLSSYPLPQASQLVHGGAVVQAESGQAVPWEPAPMVVPASRRLKQLVGSAEYWEAVKAALAKLQLALAQGIES